MYDSIIEPGIIDDNTITLAFSRQAEKKHKNNAGQSNKSVNFQMEQALNSK